jgi:hypothetical protein
MSTLVLEPRDAGVLDVDLNDGFFDTIEGLTHHEAAACVSTCVSGFTLVCDGNTFSRTCVTGATLRCDG